MATLKVQDIEKMNEKEREGKIKELKLELIKNSANASKSGAGKTKEIKKIIARILTLNKPVREKLKTKETKSPSRVKSEKNKG